MYFISLVSASDDALRDVYIADLAGFANHKNEKEIWLEDMSCPTTVEFVNNSMDVYIIRAYDKHGKLLIENDFKDGKLHGKSIGIHNGAKVWEEHYKDGKLHGKSTGWYADGVKCFEGHYLNGKRQ